MSTLAEGELQEPEIHTSPYVMNPVPTKLTYHYKLHRWKLRTIREGDWTTFNALCIEIYAYNMVYYGYWKSRWLECGETP